MQTSTFLAVWAFVAFLLFKLATFVLEDRRHRKNERQLGCERPPTMVNRDGLGIANVIEIFQADKARRIPDYIKERAENFEKRTGKVMGTFSQKLLGTPGIFTLDPKNVQAVLATQFKDFGLGELRNKVFSPLLGDGIFSSDGRQWEHSRALLRPQFVREQVSDLDLEEEHVQNMFQCLPVNSDGWTSVSDIQKLFFRLTLDSATEFLFGESVNSQLAALPGHRMKVGADADQFATSFDLAQAQIGQSIRLGEKYWLKQNSTFKQHCKNCHDFIDSYVHSALSGKKTTKTTPSGKDRYVFLDAVADSTRDPLFLRHQMISILLAGRDTTASMLSFAFLELSRQPHVFRKLREVILDEFGTYSNPKEITFAKLKSCTYLQWFLNETLRLYPVVPIDGRRALKDTTLPTGGGPDGRSPVYVREGMQVDYCVYVIHRRKDLWGPDADEFRPERWDGRRVGWEYLPFNGGPRICIGQQFALTEAGYVIVRTLQRFDAIEGVGNSWEPVEKGGVGYVRHWLTLTSCPADGVKVRLREAKE